MKEHLSPEEIERLGNYELRGEALLSALLHVEDCEECRRKIKPPSKAELIKNMFCENQSEKEEFQE